MDFKATNTKQVAPRSRAGFTLIEIMFSVGITSLCLGVLAMFFVFSTHSFTTLYNYVDLDDVNRVAMDQLTRDVRQANRVTAFTTNSLVLEEPGATAGSTYLLTYTYNSSARTLTRSQQNGPTSTLLKECDRLSFVIAQRNLVPGSYDVYPTATPDTAKVINVSWSCSRKVFGLQEDTESVQTARIVIRKQGTS